MVEAPSLLFAFAAGFVSFVSPCCLPLVPGYLAVISDGEAAKAARFDGLVLRRSLIFVAGFSLVFIALGLTATALGALLRENHLLLEQLAGVTIVAFGLFMLASTFVVALNRDWRPSSLMERARSAGPLLTGVAFAIAWTPCVGPTLGAILTLASVDNSAVSGAGLLGVYSLGLAIPFLLAALGYGAMGSFRWFKRHFMAVQLISAGLMIGMGVLVLTGELFRLNIEAQRLLDEVGLNFWQSV
jgi:cytochrome c-type biogenesis protein